MKINTCCLVLAAALAFAGNVFATITYYHNDLVGSPVVATDESGAVVWRESYRPYGERLVNDGASRANGLWFAGHRQDSSGLVQMGARYYDPVVGRFYSTDPVLFDDAKVHSFNRYAYANNNPYRFVDPDGRTPIDVGFALWDGGQLAGALAAWAVATVNGDLALQSVAVEGIREGRVDAGISMVGIVLPVSPRVLKAADLTVGRAARSVSETAEFAKLSKKLASEAQLSERGISIAGSGTSNVFRDAERVAAEHGGTAADWVKKTSKSYKAPDGTSIQTHWAENVSTGQRVEFKTVFSNP